MVTVTVRELRNKTSEVVRLARESGNEVQIMYRGEVVALLIPIKPVKRDYSTAWTKLDLLAAEIGGRWPKGIPAGQAVSEARG